MENSNHPSQPMRMTNKPRNKAHGRFSPVPNQWAKQTNPYQLELEPTPLKIFHPATSFVTMHVTVALFKTA